MKTNTQDYVLVGRLYPGGPHITQNCKKCGARHESDHLLFLCQADPDCGGKMTHDLNPHNYTDEGDHISD